MERKPLAFKLMVDPKDVRRTMAMITGEVMTDEEINEKFFDREPIEIEPPEEDTFEMTAAFSLLMIADELEKEPKKISRFSQKMAAVRRGRDKGDSL